MLAQAAIDGNDPNERSRVLLVRAQLELGQYAKAAESLATARAAIADFQAFCQETGHALLAWSEESGVFSFVIRRRDVDPAPKDD
mgnify:CR=1 FL=1